MKWIKASERLPEQPDSPINPPVYLCRFNTGKSEDGYIVGHYSAYIMQDIRRENDWEWLDESPESPSPSFQEAAEAYVNALTSLSETQKPPLIMAFVAGWNARDSQQTAPILTREVFDKIWDNAVKWAYDEPGQPKDKEAFAKSLNL